MIELKNAPPREKRYFLYVLGVIAFTVTLIFIFFRYNDFAHVVGIVANAVMPFLCGLIVAFILNAFVNLFENILFKPINRRFSEGKVWNKIRRPITLVLSYMILLALLALILFFIIPELIKSGELFAQTASKTVPGYMDTFSKWVTETVNRYNLNIDVKAVQDLFFGNFNLSSIFSNLSKVTADLLTSLVTATVNLASGIFTVIMSLIYSAYFLSGKEKLGHTFKKVLYAYTPRKIANRISMFLSVSNNIFSNYVRGQLTECLILGTLCYIGMSIIGLEYALLISVILTISALIPLLGAYIGAFLGAILLLMVTPLDALWFLIFIVVLQQFEGNVIYPRVVGSSMGLPGIWTLTAVMVFGSLFGILGIIIGTPSAAVVYTLLKHNTNRRLHHREITESVLSGSEMQVVYKDILSPQHTEEAEGEPGEPGYFQKLWDKLTARIRDYSGKH